MFQSYIIKIFSTVALLLMAFTGLNVIPRQSHPNISGVANAEASTPRDIVFVFDTSGSMAYETTGNPFSSDSGDDPSACNANNTCQPMQAVKDEALEFVNLLDFSKDRVAIITMTSQTPGGSRDPVEVLPLTSDQAAVQAAIQNIKVFEPRICDGSGAPGECLHFVNGTFNKSSCEIFELAFSNSDPNVQASADPSSCPSSNIGGVLKLAQQALAGSGDPESIRLDASWEVIALVAGPANASTPDVNHPYGYCPQNTWLFMWMPDPKPKFCRDAIPGNERGASSPLVNYTNPVNGQQMNISLYDAEDYARDMADNLAAMRSGGGVKIYTIGIGGGVASTYANGTPAVTCTIEEAIGPRPCGEAEYLLTYISHEAGDTLTTGINHGEYFYAPTEVVLGNIFKLLASTAGLCYVNDDASGANTGASWANAYTSLQFAITDSCTEIWVAAGTYKPQPTRTVSFVLENGTAIYGGFAGTESLRSERNPSANPTILSGDLNNDDIGFTNNSENSYHVVIGTTGATLDGFTISGGNANGSNPHDDGGGMFISSSSPSIANITFINNSATGFGGGMYIQSGGPTITNATFTGNNASTGGGVYVEYGSVTLTNVTISGNSATSIGGLAIYGGDNGGHILKNVIIANNASPDCAYLSGFGNINPTSSNNLIEVNESMSPCNLSHGVNGNIIGSDPNLGSLTGSPAYFPLNTGSPAIDAGTNTGCPAIDQRGVTRPQGGTCDIGSYEVDALPSITSIVRASTSPTTATSLNFTVTFSEDVTGVDANGSDFSLTASSGLPSAAITGVTGSGSTYTVSINTGSGSGTLRLDVLEGATIKDLTNNDLSGLPFTSGQEYLKTLAVIYKSNAANDGWILESAEASNAGGSLNSATTTVTLGDDGSDREYRAILHFDTSALPDTAVVTNMILKIKQQGSVVGTNPFSFASLYVDMRNPAFGGSILELIDFNFAAKKVKSAVFNPTPVSGWYSARFNNGGNLYVNRTGTTQLRLYFSTGDNNNSITDFIRFFSGNAAAGDRPKLIITYSLP